MIELDELLGRKGGLVNKVGDWFVTRERLEEIKEEDDWEVDGGESVGYAVSEGVGGGFKVYRS